MPAPRLDQSAVDELRVLIVDDEPRLAEVLSRALALEGWTTRATFSGLDAVQAAADFKPQVVVLDIGLPDISGFEVLRRLRDTRPSRVRSVLDRA